VALRFAYQDNERDGYGSSVATGQGDFENQHRVQARVGALWRPNAGFDAYWTYEHFEAHEAGALLHPLHGTQVEQLGQAVNQFVQADPLLTGIAPVVYPTSPYQTDAGLTSYDRSHFDATQLTLHQALAQDLRATAILAYRHLANDTALDVDATSLPFADTLLGNTSSQKSIELQLQGLAMDRRLDWVAGLYGFRDDGSAPSTIPAQPAAYQALFTALNLQIPQLQIPVISVPVIESNAIENTSTAAFLHGEFRATERWAFAAGLRHTNDGRRVDENAYAATPLGPSCTIVDANTQLPLSPGACPPVDKSVGYGYWSWEVSTHYRVSEELNTYFRSGRAQRSGGWNVPVNTIQDQPFHPEELTDYELGAKADLLGGAWTIDGDVFYGNYDEMQRLLPRLAGGTPTTFVINAGKARVSGAELESALHPSRNWWVQAALGWTDARYRQFLYSGIPGMPQADLSGNEFYQTPKFNAGLGAGCEVPLGFGVARLHADYAWQDAVQFNLLNDFNRQGAYGTLNARAAYGFAERGDWEVAFFGSNLTNRQYAVTGGSVAAAPPPTTQAPAMSWQIPGPPRMVGVGLRYRFGG
jgi:iron complex outermembrane receptor protein